MCSKVMDFLTDDDFINYVLGVTLQSASQDRKSTRLNSSHRLESRMPSSA